jgi:hypothetical protein
MFILKEIPWQDSKSDEMFKSNMSMIYGKCEEIGKVRIVFSLLSFLQKMMNLPSPHITLANYVHL